MTHGDTIDSSIEVSPLSTGGSSKKLPELRLLFPDQFRDDTLVDLLFDLLDIWTMFRMSQVCVAWRRKLDGQSNPGSELQGLHGLWHLKWEQIYGKSTIGTSGAVYRSVKHLCVSVYWTLDEEIQDSEAKKSKLLLLDALKLRCEDRLSAMQRKFAEETHWGRRVFVTSVDIKYCNDWEIESDHSTYRIKLRIFPRHRDPMLGPIAISFQYIDIDTRLRWSTNDGLLEFKWRDSPGICDTLNCLFKCRVEEFRYIDRGAVFDRHEFFRLNDAIFGKGNCDNTDTDEACYWLHALLRQALVYDRKSDADGDDESADFRTLRMILDVELPGQESVKRRRIT